ncbi:ECF transporter S component [Limosilactobacillus fermentum]|uniref:Uncharacterized protein n=1 Tax=Limosilactobacillus fermentum TaxID=1613 RepID=A0A1D7ZW33_LIMFE|nr:ECF transporter S component [Limosilactobacillus fermentum]AOR74019.1 hypothetical protein LACFE_CDS0550 [Limosilactobacillus fermentum]
MKHFTLKDIIFIMLIALILGALFVGTDVIYAPLYLVIGPFANEVLFGLWIMAGPLAIAILRLPGTAVIGEVLAAVAGSELGFLTLHYKNWGWPALISSAFWVTVVSFAYEIFKQGYIHLALPMILALFCTRLVSDLLFGAVLVHYVVRLLVRAPPLSRHGLTGDDRQRRLDRRESNDLAGGDDW